MNWQYNDYCVDVDSFNAHLYNTENFKLTELPITSQGAYVEGELYLHHRIDLTDSENIITTGLPSGVEFAVVIPNATSRINSITVSNVDRVSKPWDWVESWQGYALTEDDYSTYNPDNAINYNPSSIKLTKGTHYEVEENQINFYETKDDIISLLSSDIIQIDFHIDYEFTELDYTIQEGANTYNVELHWNFPDASYLNWHQFEYHPDLTSSTAFNVSFAHLSEYASVDDFKSTYTEEFQFYPNEYNFTTFEFTGFDDDKYEVSLNLTYGGEFQERWWDVEPFGMTVQTESGERYLDHNYFKAWQHDEAYEEEPIFTFYLSYEWFENYIDIIEDSEVLVTYYYKKESVSYYTKYDNILYGPGYELVIKDSNNDVIETIGNIASIQCNNITFTDAIYDSLSIGDNFSITYQFKTIGGLLDTKHVFIEVQPYHMQFYNNYYPFSGASILAPLYYNLSANYQYQLALNYRLQEKSILSFEFTVDASASEEFDTFNLGDDLPESYPDDTPIVLAHFINSTNDRVYIEDKYVELVDDDLKVNISAYRDQGLEFDSKVFVDLYADLHNKYQFYHNLKVNLGNNHITLLNWTTAQSPEDTLMANYESSHFIYDIDPYNALSKGKVQQIFAILNNSNSLIYYITEDLNDATSGWESYDTLIMKMGFLNPDVLSYLNVSFYYNQDTFIGSTKVTLDMFEDDSGTMYISLPDSNDWDQFTISNNASIIFTPIFNNHTEFLGDFYGEGLPTTQTIEWDSTYADGEFLNVDLIRRIFSENQSVIVFNELYEPIYEITEVDTRMQSFEIYDNRRTYSVEYNNISLPRSYIDPNGNLMVMKDGDILYLKYNASLESAIGFTVDEMVLQRAPYIDNYLTGQPDVPIAEISLIGINTDGNYYTIEEDMYADREELVAWETQLDLTPFESEFYNTYQQRVFNISFDDIYSDFKVLDSNNLEHCYITDILITSNDPRYQIVVDSFFIFEFDYNATLYDSEIFDIYPNNHIKTFYYGDYTDIYGEIRTLDATEFLPLYSDNFNINETWYFDAFDDDGNYYYFDSHLFAINTSSGIYDIIWNPMYSGEYYDAYEEEKSDLADLYDYYQPHIANFSYLYVSWADENAWNEWHTIEAPNVNISTLDIMFEWYDDTSEEYDSVYYNQTLNEFEARNIAVEIVYPYDKNLQTANFTLSQDYSNAQDLDIMLIKGYFFNETGKDFDPDNVNIYPSEKLIEISAPNGYTLKNFEKIIVYLNFTEGAYSDYTQFRFLQAAIDNNPEVPLWTKNDSLYIDFEYNDIDYFLLMEDYAVGSEDSMFEYFAYTRNSKFVDYDDVIQTYSLDKIEQYQDFDNFTKVSDPRTLLEFFDFDEDCSHEIVIQKDDITQNGVYDSFKYGYINPAGEITFHTLVQEVATTEVHTDKINDVRETGRYGIGIIGDYTANAQRTIITNSTITYRIQKLTTLIQKDNDYDGYIDHEVSYEQTYYSSYTVLYSTEINHIHFKLRDGSENLEGGQEEYDGYLTEYRNSTYISCDSSMSYAFRDFEYGEVVNTRYYDDVFPNELSEVYNLDNNLVPVINDNGDEDSSNDVTTYVPALENLLSLSHPRDGVSAIFDRRIIINDSVEFDNILATQRVISIPATYNEGTGINDYLTEQKIVADVIEVVPEMGVYYDNVRGYAPDNLKGYRYLYYDEDGDGLHNTIFITDSDGEVVGIGFDYDGNSYFEPHKVMITEKHIITSAATADVDKALKMTLKYAGHKLINYEDTDSYDGVFVEPTFRDSLFDIWKSQYTGTSSKLIKLAMQLTSQQFAESLSPEKIIGDIAWQVVSQLTAFVVGKITAIAIIGSCSTIGSSFPGIGTAIGFLVGMLVYWLLNSMYAIAQQKEINNYLASQTTYNEEYQTTETLSEKWWQDRYFGDIMPNTLQGSMAGIYTPVKAETDKHIYEGEVILAPAHIQKTANFGTQFNPLLLDYSQQTRSYLQYSDFDDPLLMSFFNQDIEEFYGISIEQLPILDSLGLTQPRDPRALYMRNSIMYLEDEIYKATESDPEDSVSYDRLIPYMVGVRPSLQFVDSDTVLAPEFHLDYPIYVNHEEYDALEEDYYHIYKVYNGTTDIIQLIPEDTVENRIIMSDIVNIVPYYVDSLGNQEILPLDIDYIPEFIFNAITGEVILNSSFTILLDEHLTGKEDLYNNVEGYEGHIILEFCIEKYRDISVERDDITPEEANTIATMQSAHQAILEYIYQFTIAEQTQQRLSETCYTIFVTIISTLIVMGATIVIDKAFSKLANNLFDKLDDAIQAGTAGKRLANLYSKMNTGELFNNLLNPASRGLGYNMFKITTAMISESIEEVFVDPWISAYVTNAVADLGWDETAQIYLSGLAETGREFFFSAVTRFMRASIKPQTSLNLQNTAAQQHLTIEQMNEMRQQAQEAQIQKDNRKDYIRDSFFTVIMFMGAMMGGIFGSDIAAFSNIMIIGGASADSLFELKDAVKGILESKHQRQQRVQQQVINDKLLDIFESQVIATELDLIEENEIECLIIEALGPEMVYDRTPTPGQVAGAAVLHSVPKRFNIRTINLKGQAKRIVNNHLSYIKTIRRQLGFKGLQRRLSSTDKIIKREDVQNFDDLVSIQGRRKLLWYGIVYEIISPRGSKYGGLTITSLTVRWEKAVKNAIKHPSMTRDFDQEVWDVLLEGGSFMEDDYKHASGSWNWGKIFAILNDDNLGFKKRVVRIAFSQRSLRKAEHDFISEFNLISDGLNMLAGGNLGRNRIELPMLFIAQYVAMGLNIKEIAQLLRQQGWYVSETTVRRRINDYFGNFEEAQILFLRPMLESLIKQGYELFEINSAFGRFIGERIKAFFGGKTFGELLTIINQDWSQLEISRAGSGTYWVHEGIYEDVLPLATIFYLLENIFSIKAAALSDYFRSILSGKSYHAIRKSLSDQIRAQIGFDYWFDCKDYYLTPYIIEEYRGWDASKESINNLAKRVWSRYGYSESQAFNSHNLYSRRLFNSLNTLDAVNFLKTHPTITNLREFRQVFYAEKGKFNVKTLTKAEIDHYLIKYMHINDAIKDLGMEYGYLKEQVENYYTSWAKGREEVVFTSIVNSFRSIKGLPSVQQIYNSFRSVGYKTPNSHNRDTRRLFEHRFLTTREAIEFFQIHPTINTRSQFRAFFSNPYSCLREDNFL